VPFCSCGEQRDDRGGVGRLPAAPARGPDGSRSRPPCLRGREIIGYPDGKTAGRSQSVAARAIERMRPLTLPPVGRAMPPGGLSDVDLLSYSHDWRLGGRDCGSSQESGRHASPDDLGDLPGRLG
jgi:hypothetical protein